MRIKETKHSLTVVWSPKTEANLTWGDVKTFCSRKMADMKSSKEYEDIKSIKRTIAILEAKCKSFDDRFNRYERMFNAIKNDEINTPVKPKKEGDEE